MTLLEEMSLSLNAASYNPVPRFLFFREEMVELGQTALRGDVDMVHFRPNSKVARQRCVFGIFGDLAVVDVSFQGIVVQWSGQRTARLIVQG